MGEQVRLLIADDHAMFRAGLRKLLEAEPGLHVVGEAENGQDATTLARELQPDILLLDLSMPGMTGTEVLRSLRDAGLPTRTVVLTASIDRLEMETVLGLGAAGVLLKPAATELLHKCVRAVADGLFWVGRGAVTSLGETSSSRPPPESPSSRRPSSSG